MIMIRNYTLEQQFKITDENARDIKNIKFMICAVEDGVESGNMETVLKDMAASFVDYLHSESAVETDNSWNDLETMFSVYNEPDNKSKGLRGWWGR